MQIDHTHFIHKAIKEVRPLYIFIFAVAMTAVCVTALRSNNERMITLRDNVYTADKNNTDVQVALQKLQAYVTTHMNTDLSTGAGSVYPPIQLQYTYQRELASETQSTQNTQLYTQAEDYCQAQIPTGFSGRYRIGCIDQYVQSHNISLPSVPASMYKFDFVSPTWSPDLAGWSLVITIIGWLLFVSSLLWTKFFSR
ncbi:MAG TPA: hypothetical protein VFN51_03675 [Candidatus Saccharimonadales bacterium]|nr:hypothetical protein [Candidatus Saccharimonadales bacterium]